MPTLGCYYRMSWAFLVRTSHLHCTALRRGGKQLLTPSYGKRHFGNPAVQHTSSMPLSMSGQKPLTIRWWIDCRISNVWLVRGHQFLTPGIWASRHRSRHAPKHAWGAPGRLSWVSVSVHRNVINFLLQLSFSSEYFEYLDRRWDYNDWPTSSIEISFIDATVRIGGLKGELVGLTVL